jgi:ribosomal protein S18 acetylase RimI-like enzyme
MIDVRPAEPRDTAAVAAIHARSWGGSLAVAHGVAYDLSALSTLVAVDPDDAVLGALTYVVEGDALEVVSIDAAAPRLGVGTALLAAAVDLGRERRLRRVWLITTNDNLDALRFYQRRGLRLIAIEPDAIEASRRLKPSISAVGAYGIPLRDELTLELLLD